MTPHQQILAFELRRAGLHINQAASEVRCDSNTLGEMLRRNASKPIEVEVPRYMTPTFIRQSVLTIMRKYRGET